MMVWLALLPIIALIIVSLVRSVQVAALVSFILTAIIFFALDSPLSHFLASMVVAGFSTINILMIVFGAVFLYETMKTSGYINNIAQSIQDVHRAPDVRFFMIAIGLTAFFEGVAGFGTPGAIVPLLLISMGYSPITSVVAVLLFNGLFAAFGAVGTPLQAGIADTLRIEETTVLQSIAVKTAWLLAISGIIFLIASFIFYQRSEGKSRYRFTIAGLYISTIIIFTGCAYFIPAYATILSGFIMLLLAILIFTRGKIAKGLQSWLPYLLLVTILLIPKIIPDLQKWLHAQILWTGIFSTGIDAGLKPFQSPLVPFLIVGFLFCGNWRNARAGLLGAGGKVQSVAIILFPLIAIAQLMQVSGNEQVSMISMIANAFSNTGRNYVFIAPFIGMTGSFVTGSTTVSNIVFASSQQETALLLGLDPSLILSLQLAGASIGNSVCLFNIIAACAVANIKSPNMILQKNLFPVLAATSLIALLAYFIPVL